MCDKAKSNRLQWVNNRAQSNFDESINFDHVAYTISDSEWEKVSHFGAAEGINVSL